MTVISEIGDRIYRIHTPSTRYRAASPSTRFLVVDDEPLLFHTGGRRLFGR